MSPSPLTEIRFYRPKVLYEDNNIVHKVTDTIVQSPLLSQLFAALKPGPPNSTTILLNFVLLIETLRPIAPYVHEREEIVKGEYG